VASDVATFLNSISSVPFRLQIQLISEYEYGSLLTPDLLDVLDPLINIAIAVLICITKALTGNIEHDDGCVAVFDVARDERVEALLPGRVPQLHPQCFVLHVYGFRHEVHAYCWLKSDCRYLLVAGEVVEDETVDD
jgi:hypothetical protein